MATTDHNLADRSGNLVESHKGYDPRVVFFYFVLAALLLILAAGLAWQQLVLTVAHTDAERMQNHRRILVPGPRGNIYDRHGLPLVVNRPRFSVVLYLDQLREEFRRDFIRIRKNYRDTGDKDIPSSKQLSDITRVSVAQRYLDQVNAIIGRTAEIDARKLRRHFESEKLLPFTLIEDLEPEEYARLIERLPVGSPLQVYTSSTRSYPNHSAAAHTLGYLRRDEDITAEDFPGDDLMTFKMKGTVGENGLEKSFDDLLQGEAGGAIYLVDPAGFKVAKPVAKRLPKQGKNLITSLDLELQLTAEEAIGDQIGAAVALDVATGEVLVMASKPDYDLENFSPAPTQATMDDIVQRKAWFDLALKGVYSPGSTFKILVATAGLRSGRLDPTDTGVECDGYIRIGNRSFGCENGHAHHGMLELPEAITQSCDIYFYRHGIDITPDVIAAEARRFHLDVPTGIELPGETRRMLIPTPAWKKEKYHETWTDGDTANMAIGQGFVDVTPLQMACFIASFARGETVTKPTLVHIPDRPPQHTEPIGLTPAQRAKIVEGMEGVVTRGTAHRLLMTDSFRLPGVRLAGKTGTAQKDVKGGKINVAWFICFAPVEKPEIAMAVTIVGDTVGENFEGGQYAAPIAALVMKKYFEQKTRPQSQFISPLKTEE